MTKKELYSKNMSVDFEKYLNKFFSQNVVIPKGQSRHPYADVLHEWIEGADIEYMHIIDTSYSEFKSVHNIFDSFEYRIKPQEPIYEWQWYDIDRNTEVFMVNSGKFMTEDEAGELTTFGFMRKFEETKRERK